MSRRSVTVKDVPADAFIKACAEFLKRQPKFDVPKWHDIVKTGTLKEYSPYDEDWFFVRSASILRKVYMRNGVGVGALRRIYGKAKNRGVRPEHFSKAGGAIIRSILQNLENVRATPLPPPVLLRRLARPAFAPSPLHGHQSPHLRVCVATDQRCRADRQEGRPPHLPRWPAGP